jgi:hypothetical protein
MGGMIKCKKCGKVLHSMYTHDFKACNCGSQVFVDGGFDYCRIGGNPEDFVVLSHAHCEGCGKALEECVCASEGC